MSAAPARRSVRSAPRRGRTPEPAPPERARSTGDRGAARRRVSVERRRRQRHFARRRRDLLEDAGVALTVSLVLVVFTAGLGVLALLMMLLVAVIAGLAIAQRVITSRRAGSRSSPRRRR